MKQKLFVDMDDTIVQSRKAYCEYYNTHYCDKDGFKVANHLDNAVWGFSDVCPLAVDDVDEIFGTEELFNRLTFNHRAYEVLERLSKDYEIIVVSLGTYNNTSEKAKWIKKHLPFINESVLLCKNGVMMDKTVVNMKGGIFIDDVKDNLDSTNASRKILFGRSMPWNVSWNGEYCATWEDIELALTHSK